MKYAVVTGTSRGLGTSIAKQLLEQQVHVIGISRRENAKLQRIAEQNNVTYEHHGCDLSHIKQVESTFSAIAGRLLAKAGISDVFLIHNAGVVDPIHAAGSYDTDRLTDHVHINLLSPMIATNIFLREAAASSVSLTVVNVTSGAAERSVYGWSAYSSTKAGLNRYTQTIALEQDERKTGNKAILFNPGVMNTDMQGEIRASSKEAFKDVESFKQYKETNRLRDTEVVAGVLLNVLKDVSKIENGKNYSVYDLL